MLRLPIGIAFFARKKLGGMMFGIGAQELLVIAIVALLIVGPKKLPEIARSLGKGFQEFKKTAEDVTGGIKDSFVETEPSTAAKDPFADQKSGDEKNGDVAIDTPLLPDKMEHHKNISKPLIRQLP